MTFLKEGSDKGGLRGWFEGGGWDRYDSKGNKIGKCGGRKKGEAKPKCFSKEKAAALGKKGRAQAVRRKRREDPNPNAKGKPINTPSTKKGLKKRKKRESMSDFTDGIVKQLLERTKKKKKAKKAAKKDACYHKVKATASKWPSAYASGRLVQCRKKGASNYGNKRKDEEDSVTVTSDSGASKTLTGARARKVKSKAQDHVERGTAGRINPGKHMTSSGGRAGQQGGVELPFGDIKIHANTKIIGDAILEALKCWKGYKRVKGKTPGTPGSCKKIGEGYKVSPEQAKKMRDSLAAAQAERRRHGAGNYRGSGAEGATSVAKEARVRGRKPAPAGVVQQNTDQDIKDTGRTRAPGSY